MRYMISMEVSGARIQQTVYFIYINHFMFPFKLSTGNDISFLAKPCLHASKSDSDCIQHGKYQTTKTNRNTPNHLHLFTQWILLKFYIVHI